jgi:AcrR family transcriptional regulator
MDDIARKAGVSRPTIYRYFRDRDTLITAMIESRSRALFKEASKFLKSRTSFQDQLVDGLVYLVDHGRKDPIIRVLVNPEHMDIAMRLVGEGTHLATKLTKEMWEPYIERDPTGIFWAPRSAPPLHPCDIQLRQGHRSPAVKSAGCGVERLECGVEPLLAAPVELMIGLGRHEPDQLVQVIVSGSEDSAVVVGADPEHQSFAVGVQQPQLAQRRGHLVTDDDLADSTRYGEPSAPEIEQRVLPVADHSFVVTDAAPPPDRRARLCLQHNDPTRAAAMGRPASARQRAYPRTAGIAGCGCPDDVAQVLRQATCGTGRVLGQVEEVVQVGDQHFEGL